MTLKTLRLIKQRIGLLENRLKNYSFSTVRSYVATAAETDLTEILKRNFPSAKNIVVQDISGGCGAMYSIYVESIDLKGLSIIKQHQAVTNALKEQIKTFHGVRIETKVPQI